MLHQRSKCVCFERKALHATKPAQSAIALALAVGTIGLQFPIGVSLALNGPAVRMLAPAADEGGGFRAFLATLLDGLPGVAEPRANDSIRAT